MPTTTVYRFGDIVLVAFPFTDQTTLKKRPAVVISSRAYHEERPDVIVMAVTSRLAAARSGGDVAIQEWRQAGLLKPSLIKPVVATIERRLIQRILGSLGGTDAAALRSVLNHIIG